MDLLAVEVIEHIFSLLSPWEVVRLRQVSKKFCDITHSHTLWKEIYANVCLPLPPGPFSWQSTRYLERTLVHSDLVAKSWMTRPLKLSSFNASKWRGEGINSWTVVFGRWCIFLDGNTIRCHDIDSNTYHFLYDGTAHPTFLFTAHTASPTDMNGFSVYLSLAGTNDQHEFRRLLAFRLDDKGFSEPEITDMTHISRPSAEWLSFTSRPHIVSHGSTPFLVLAYCRSCVVLDLRTRRFYSLPVPTGNIPRNLEQNEPPIHSTWYHMFTTIIPTKTHVIAIQTYTKGGYSHATIIQAFVAPDTAMHRGANTVGELRLTHEEVIHIFPHSFGLLRNSMIDPVTGSVNIKLFLTNTFLVNPIPSHLSCLDLTLPQPRSSSDTDVLPISIHSQHLFESRWHSERTIMSDDGFVWGIFLTESGATRFQVNSARKFSVDATGNDCTVAVGDPCPVRLPSLSKVVLGGTRGRIHYSSQDDGRQVITADLA